MATRLEKVVLDLDDRFTRPMAQATAATLGMEAALKRLDGQTVRTSTSTKNVERDVTKTSSAFERGSAAIDSYSGRLSLLAQTALVLGPGLLPIAAVGVPAATGLAAGLAAGAAAGGSLILALQGVGDATKAIDAYRLERTPENLAKLHEEMAKIGPEARDFARSFQDFQHVLADLRDAAASGWLPGLSDTLENLAVLAPRAERLLEAVGTTGGSILANSTAAFTTGRWTPFFNFVTSELPETMRSLAEITGDLTHGAAEMWMAFDPGNDKFLDWMTGVADAFDDWASSAQGRQDVAAFLAYVEETGPKVEELFLALVDALTQITQAAAPLSGPVVDSLAAVARVVADIANSDLGTPIMAGVAALSIYNRMLATTKALQSSTFAQGFGGQSTGLAFGGFLGRQASGIKTTVPTLSQLGRTLFYAGQSGKYASEQTLAARSAVGQFAGSAVRAAGPIAALAVATTGVADSANLSNTALLGLSGMMLGPWGATAGTAIGFTLDLAHANDTLQASIDAANASTGDDSLSLLLKRRKELISNFQETTTSDAGFLGLGGDISRIASFFGNDDNETLAAVHHLDTLIALVRSLKDVKSTSGFGGLNELLAQYTGRVADATAATYDFQGALESANEFLSKRGALSAYEAALDAVTKSIKDNGESLDVTTGKGRANLTTLDNIASAGLRVADSLHGKPRQTFLDNLKSDITDTLERFNQSKAQIHDYLHELGLIDSKKVKPKVDLDDSDFERKRRRAEQGLGLLDGAEADPFVDLFTDPLDRGAAHARGVLADLDGRRATTYVDTVHRDIRQGVSAAVSAQGGVPGSADGTTVPKTGRGYADRHLYLLADGEEVISNRYGQADRHRALLKRINANARLAAGGTASGYGPGGIFGGSAAVHTAAPDPYANGMYAGSISLYDTAMTAKETARALKVLKSELDKATSSLQKEQQARQQIIQQVSGNFLDDPFAVSQGSGDIFSAGATPGGTVDPLAALRGDIKNARAYRRIIANLRKSGIKGSALAEIDTLEEAQAIRDLSPAQRREYQRLYGARASAARSAGAANAQGSAATVAELQALRAEVKGLRGDVKAAEKANDRAHDRSANKIKDGINKGATEGDRK